MNEAVVKITDRPTKTKSQSDKAVKFRDVGAQRVNHILNVIRLIGNLSNRSSYAYSDGDVQRMFGKIKDALAKTEGKFAPSYRDQDKFSF